MITLKVDVLTPIPTPYRDPFWEALADGVGIELRVLFCAVGKADRPWRSCERESGLFEVLSGFDLLGGGDGSSAFLNPRVLHYLGERRPDALLLGGYNHPTMLLALCWALVTRTPVFLMCETHQGSGRGGWRSRVRSILLRLLLPHIAGALPTGRLAQAFLRCHGMAPERMELLPNAPDQAALVTAAELGMKRRGSILADIGFPADSRVVLFVGRFIVKKRVLDLVDAFCGSDLPDDARLVLVGDGEERAAIETRIAASGMGSRIRLTGFLEPEAVWRWYGVADLYVLPSAETWGVSALEAMGCGLPLVLSDAVGSHPDLKLLDDGVRVVPFGDVASLGDAITATLDDIPAGLPRVGSGDPFRAAFGHSELAARTAQFLAYRLSVGPASR